MSTAKVRLKTLEELQDEASHVSSNNDLDFPYTSVSWNSLMNSYADKVIEVSSVLSNNKYYRMTDAHWVIAHQWIVEVVEGELEKPKPPIGLCKLED